MKMSHSPVFAVFCLFLTLFALSASAQVPALLCDDYHDKMGTLPAEEFGGPVQAVDSVGSLIYAACGEGGFWVLEGANFGSPVSVAHLELSGDALGIEIVGNHAYLPLGANGMAVVDISSPSAPVLVTTLPLLQWVNDIEVVGDRLYVFGASLSCQGGSWLHVVDASDPADPVLVDSYEFASDLMDISVDGNLAGMARTRSEWFETGPDWFECIPRAGMGVLDITDPDVPAVLFNTDLQWDDTITAVELVDGYMYVAEAHYGLTIHSVADPANPLYLDTLEFDHGYNEYVKSMARFGDLLYVTTYAGWLVILDVSNPTAPFVQDEIKFLYQAKDLASVGTHLYLACGEDGLCTMRINDPLDPYLPHPETMAFSTTPLHTQGAVAMSGNLVFTCDDQLRVYDVTDPSGPELLSYVPTVFTRCGSMAVEGTRVYVDGYSTPEQDVAIFDVTDPSNPELLTYLSANSSGEAPMHVEGGVLYRGFYDLIQATDVTDPLNPVTITLDLPGTPLYGSAKRGDLLYYYGFESFNDYRLFIVDISDPASPVERGRVEVPWGHDIRLEGDRAYLFSSPGFAIVDIADPANPTLISQTYTDGNCQAVIPSGGLLYAGNYHTLRVFDLADESAPILYGTLPLDMNDLATNGHILAAHGNTQLFILPLDCSDDHIVPVNDNGLVPDRSASLLSAYPNPFNPTVRIVLALPRDQEVTLRIHDLRGRLVKELARQAFAVGRQEIDWYGRDSAGRSVASGSYFVVLETEDGRDVQKLTLVR